MPETFDDLFAAVSADVTARSRAPGAQEAIATSRRRSARVAAASVTAVLVGVLVITVLSITVLSGNSNVEPAPAPSPERVVGDVPVWYDAEGLHRGHVVEQTPVEIGHVDPHDGDTTGALALVRTGALYQDPATGDVWFHPWGGEPRIVGHNSTAGPGGDPNGDTAAWFDGAALIVYDTAAGREISRTSQSFPLMDNCGGMCAEHYSAGNTFLQVSAERVVWNDGPGEWAYSHDVLTQETSLVKAPVIDMHDDASVFADSSGKWATVLSTPGRAEVRYPELEPRARMSPSGNYVLAVEETKERHGAVIVDTSTGELSRVGGDGYSWIAWSYDEIALVDTESALLACDAPRHTCERLPAERPFLMPTN